jgi:hypothetical protein
MLGDLGETTGRPIPATVITWRSSFVLINKVCLDSVSTRPIILLSLSECQTCQQRSADSAEDIPRGLPLHSLKCSLINNKSSFALVLSLETCFLYLDQIIK